MRKRDYLLLFVLLMGLSACGPKKLKVPNEVEAISQNCYLALATPERTPQLEPAKAMEDGTFLILWTMEDEDEQGSCSVDGSGALLLVTNNADIKTSPEEKTTEKTTSQE